LYWHIVGDAPGAELAFYESIFDTIVAGLFRRGWAGRQRMADAARQRAFRTGAMPPPKGLQASVTAGMDKSGAHAVVRLPEFAWQIWKRGSRRSPTTQVATMDSPNAPAVEITSGEMQPA
jgi:hypothetical protein